MSKPLFIAELTINHLGMINIAKMMIKAAKNSGANLVKLKIKNVQSYYADDTVADWRNFQFKKYRQSLELTKEDFAELDAYCKEIGMKWCSTIHDLESLDFIKTFDPPMYKVASMDIDKPDLLDAVISLCKKENKSIIMSVGGRNLEQIKELVGKIEAADIYAYILHTVSIYPTPVGTSNINFFRYLKDNIESKGGKIRIGYSGHEQGYAPSVLAGTYGAAMIERHFTLTRDYQIHHMEAALTPDEFSEMVNLIDEVAEELGSSVQDVNKDEMHFLKEMNYSQIQDQ